MEISRDLEVWKMTEMSNPLRSHGIQFKMLLLAVQDSSLRGASDFAFLIFLTSQGGLLQSQLLIKICQKNAVELSINVINQAICYIKGSVQNFFSPIHLLFKVGGE